MTTENRNCTRCGRGPLLYDKRVGVYRVNGEGSANCDNEYHMPAWRHTLMPLTDKQKRAVALWNKRNGITAACCTG
jgi:hypothetical protein